MTKPSLAEMSGEEEMSGSPKLPLNVIRIHGSKGTFIYQKVLDGLKQRSDGKRSYDTEELGPEISLTFLKIRRKLSKYKKGEKPLQTSEHTHKGQAVTLFGKEKPEVGYASDIREANPELRTNQIVYALYNGELVRVIIKGASLGSESKAKDQHTFYSYVSSFQGDEHFYEYETDLFALEEESSMGRYYCVGFKKGRKLKESEMKEVEAKMSIAFEHCKKVDEYYSRGQKQKFEEESQSSQTSDGLADEVGYPDDEIDPEDIPF